MIGKVFVRLTVVDLDHVDKKYNKYWKCVCTCGKTSVVRGSRLTSGKTKSCGCYAIEYRETLVNTAKVERRNITHKTYSLMLDRCYNPDYRNYAHFGGAGVTVCDRWRYGQGNHTGWQCFFADMGPKPKGYILGRKNKLGAYNPTNCCWTTSNNQYADITRSGRPRGCMKDKPQLTDEDAWVRRCLNNPKRRELTSEYVKSIMSTHCPLLGYKLQYSTYESKGTPVYYATLDKIDPKLGYVVGNVQVISHRANMIKNDATLTELKLMVKNWEAILKGTPPCKGASGDPTPSILEHPPVLI